MSIAPQILALIDELDALRASRDDHYQVPREEGYLLHHIALSSGARTVVEVGTSYGFSGLFFAAALRHTGGRLHTIDIEPRKHDSARQTFARAAVTDSISAYLGDARHILPTLPAPFDLAFIDADKASTLAYFQLIWPRLRPGGSVLTDNATTHRAELAEFVAHVRGLADAASVEIAVGNGIEWTVKLPSR
jgi:predicted O-methyltransferase YrrM